MDPNFVCENLGMRCAGCGGDCSKVTGGYCRLCKLDYDRNYRRVRKSRQIEKFRREVARILEEAGEGSAADIVRQERGETTGRKS